MESNLKKENTLVEFWQEVDKDNEFGIVRFLWSVDEIDGPITGRIMRVIRKTANCYLHNWPVIGGTVKALIYTGDYRRYVGCVRVGASSAGIKYVYYSNWWRGRLIRQHSSINWKSKQIRKEV